MDIKSLNELKKAAGILHLQSDLLTKQIANFEKVLNSLHLGFTTWVVIKEDSKQVISLGYGKHKEWGLLIKQRIIDDIKPNSFIWPILEAPRYARIDAIPCFNNLIEKLTKETLKQIDKVTERTLEAQEINNIINNINEKIK